MSAEKHPAPGRWSALAGLILGGSASLAANVAHAVYVLPNFSIVTLGSALFWPAAAFIGFEAVVRPKWPTWATDRWRSGGWQLLRLAVVGVFVVAVVSSYEHMAGLLGHFGEHPFTVRFGPAAVDGLMVTCAAALLVIERQAQSPTRRSAPPVTLTARPARSVAWNPPIRALADPIEAIGQTLRSVEALTARRSESATVAIGESAKRSAKRVTPPTTPRSGSRVTDRELLPLLADRSRIGDGAAGRSDAELLADLHRVFEPSDPEPTATALQTHYRIGPTRARALRDALQTDRQQQAAGEEQGEITK